MTSAIYAILNTPVRTVLDDIKKSARVDRPVVRAILDESLGTAGYAYPRPSDALEEHVLTITTDNPESAKRVLSRTPGVLRAGKLDELRPGA